MMSTHCEAGPFGPQRDGRSQASRADDSHRIPVHFLALGGVDLPSAGGKMTMQVLTLTPTPTEEE